MTADASSPIGLHRVLEPAGRAAPGGPAARHRPRGPRRRGAAARRAPQPRRRELPAARDQAHGGDGDAIRAEVLAIIRERGKMHNPVTGSGGMLIGVVDAVGPRSPLGLVARRPRGDARLAHPDAAGGGRRPGRAGTAAASRCRAAGHAILFGRSIAARLPADLPPGLALAVLDVCGAPALTRRVVGRAAADLGRPPVVAVIGGAGKSGSLALAAARDAGAGRTIGVVPVAAEEAGADGVRPRGRRRPRRRPRPGGAGRRGHAPRAARPT